jgi:pilus assembly protein CpaF
MDLPLVAVREQIASAVNLIVQQARFPCGTRRVVAITEVTGTESGRIQTQDLFNFVGRGPGRGLFSASGNEPVFFESLSPDERPSPLGSSSPLQQAPC